MERRDRYRPGGAGGLTRSAAIVTVFFMIASRRYRLPPMMMRRYNTGPGSVHPPSPATTPGRMILLELPA
jgi:hypothetical protein